MEQRPSSPHRPNSVCGHRTYLVAAPQTEHRSGSSNRPNSASGSSFSLAVPSKMEQRPSSPSRPNSVSGSRPFLVTPPVEPGPSRPSSASRFYSSHIAASPMEQRQTTFSNRPSSVRGSRASRNLIPLEYSADSTSKPVAKAELFSPRKSGSRHLPKRTCHTIVREASILDSSGLTEGSNDNARMALRLTPSTPLDLEQCEKGCYWRSLVHTLLEEVAVVKRTLDEVQNSFLQRSTERNERQQTIEHHEFLKKDLESLNVITSTSRVEGSGLREERNQLQFEAAQLCDKVIKLQAQNAHFQAEVQSYRQEQPLMESRLQEMEQQIEVQTNNNRSLMECIRHAKGELDQTNAEVQRRMIIRDQLKAEISMFEPAQRKSRRKPNTKKGGKSPREKKR